MRPTTRGWCVLSPQRRKILPLVYLVSISGCVVFLGNCENRLQIVQMYEAPMELPDTVTICRPSHYGEVFSFCRDKVADTIYSGMHTTRMRVNLKIPSIIFIDGGPICVWYLPQPKLCQPCGSEDHLVANCRTERYFNCEAPGHRAKEYTKPTLCSICIKSHSTSVCPYLRFSVNIEENLDDSLYAEVAKTVTSGASSPPT